MLTDKRVREVAKRAKRKLTLDLTEAVENARLFVRELAASSNEQQRADLYWKAKMLTKLWAKEDDNG